MTARTYIRHAAAALLIAALLLAAGALAVTVTPATSAPAPPAPAYDTCHGLIAIMTKQSYDGQNLELGVCIRSFEYGPGGVFIDGYSASGIYRNGFEARP